jgi:hypothetical protein
MKKYEKNKTVSEVNEGESPFIRTFSSQEEAEEYRRRIDIWRSDKEKLLLFTQMLRRNALYKKAKIYNNTPL